MVQTEALDGTDAGRVASQLPEPPAGVLRHERIPFVSYPYEWTFSMLKDAALLQLDLLLDALGHDMVLKDSTPYNVQFKGARPTFVDVGSFERMREGEPWVGYRQFCMLYLYPLLLQSAKGVPFQPWLRGSIDGLDPRPVVIVPGAGLRPDGGPSVYLERRLAAARDLYRAGTVQWILVSGDASTPYHDEPTSMRTWLLGQGVPASAIVRDGGGLAAAVWARFVPRLTEGVEADQAGGQGLQVIVRRHVDRVAGVARAHPQLTVALFASVSQYAVAQAPRGSEPGDPRFLVPLPMLLVPPLLAHADEVRPPYAESPGAAFDSAAMLTSQALQLCMTRPLLSPAEVCRHVVRSLRSTWGDDGPDDDAVVVCLDWHPAQV